MKTSLFRLPILLIIVAVVFIPFLKAEAGDTVEDIAGVILVAPLILLDPVALLIIDYNSCDVNFVWSCSGGNGNGAPVSGS